MEEQDFRLMGNGDGFVSLEKVCRVSGLTHSEGLRAVFRTKSNLFSGRWVTPDNAVNIYNYAQGYLDRVEK